MLALVLTVPAVDAEVAADALWALGVVAIEERGAGGLDDTGTDDHFVELWTSLGDDPDSVTTAAQGFPARWRWRTVQLDPALADTWRRHAVPTWVAADLVIVPAWLDMHVDRPGTTVVRIEPGATFGLGDHPTTVLTMRAMRAHLRPGAAVLDVGCGSGVLAVTAAMLGAGYVDAVDIAPAAVGATDDNARRNGVAALVTATTRRLDELDDQYDVVLANILAPALIALAPDLGRLTSPSGVLVISGILDAAHDHVLDALAPMQVVERLTREGWAAVVLRH